VRETLLVQLLAHGVERIRLRLLLPHRTHAHASTPHYRKDTWSSPAEDTIQRPSGITRTFLAKSK